jgi:hypothetical protein
MQKHTLTIEYWANKPLFPNDHIEIEAAKDSSIILRELKRYLRVATTVGYSIKGIISQE